MHFEDRANNVIRMVPARQANGRKLESDDDTRQSMKFSNKSKIPRPANAYILYRAEHHKLVKAKNPGLHNNAICMTFFLNSLSLHILISLAIILGQQWKGEPQEIKDYWKHQAETLKRKHTAENPEYAYHPRKSKERKRRMTPKKARILANISDLAHNFFELDHIPNMDFSTEFAEISTTQTGNFLFDVGAMPLEEERLRAATEQISAAPVLSGTIDARSTANRAPPILYDEATPISQDLQNYYSAMIDWDMVDNEVGKMYADFTMRMDQGETAFNQQLQSARAQRKEWLKMQEEMAIREYQRARAHLALN